jgi:molybdate transport system substrate-binding protein
MNRALSTGAIASMLFLGSPSMAAEVELRVWTARALATVLAETGSQFERTSGRRLVIETGLPADFKNRTAAGQRFDVVISVSSPIDAWIEEGRLIAETRTDLARSGIGVSVRAGAPKPDISSVEAFKRTLLAARSLALLRVGSGLHMNGVFERLGIAEAVRPKITRPETDVVCELVAKGEVELGIVVVTQILTTAGVELVGPLPQELQSHITFAGAVATNAAAPEAAKQLLDFLTGPTVRPVLQAQGMEPVQ